MNARKFKKVNMSVYQDYLKVMQLSANCATAWLLHSVLNDRNFEVFCESSLLELVTQFLGVTENCRSWPVQEKIKSQNFSKIYFFYFEAKHTKGLKLFRARSGYRNLLGVRGHSSKKHVRVRACFRGRQMKKTNLKPFEVPNKNTTTKLT